MRMALLLLTAGTHLPPLSRRRRSSTGQVQISTVAAEAGAPANLAPVAPLHYVLFYGSAECRMFGLTDFR